MRAMFLILGVFSVPALAAPCPDGAPLPLPAPFTSWGQPATIAATVSAAGAPQIALDRAAAVTLQPSARLNYILKPGREVKPGSFGGIVAVDVPAAGRYRLALGSFAWVDMLEDGQSLKSLERDHSLPCVSKILDFELKAGRHLIQFADDKTASSKMMLVRGIKPPAPPKPAAAH